MKPSTTKNKVTPTGKPYIVVEVGDILFFGGSLQKVYEVTDVRGSRCFHNEIDLFQLWKDSNVLPIVFEK